MIEAIEHNLQAGRKLLGSITDAQYRDTSLKPYNASIGSHVRHILDIFDCVFAGLETRRVDLAARRRNDQVEKFTEMGLAYFDRTLARLESIKGADFDQIIEVSDDLGLGEVTVKYTLASALIQAHSHAIHHYASIGYVITGLGIELPNDDFGYNPTTPRPLEASLG